MKKTIGIFWTSFSIAWLLWMLYGVVKDGAYPRLEDRWLPLGVGFALLIVSRLYLANVRWARFGLTTVLILVSFMAAHSAYFETTHDFARRPKLIFAISSGILIAAVGTLALIRKADG